MAASVNAPPAHVRILAKMAQLVRTPVLSSINVSALLDILDQIAQSRLQNLKYTAMLRDVSTVEPV